MHHHWFSLSFVHFKNGPLRGGQPRYLSFSWDFCNIVWFQVVFSFSKDIFFFYVHLFDGVYLLHSPVFVIFFFSKDSNFFLIWQFFFFCQFSFFLFLITSMVRIYVKFHTNILTILSSFVLRSPILFRFWQINWYRPCTPNGWSFPAINWVCNQLKIS